MHLSLLYRGPLSSCNYGCAYCPFAKHQESDAEHRADAEALARFLDWARAQEGTMELSVFFTPWGEALIRKRYQHALVNLTRMSHVRRAAIQTNLSSRLDWIADCDRTKLGLWATYHPTQVSRARFLAECRELDRLEARYSVGVVGLKEHFAEIEALRRALPAHVYLWINAYKRVPDYYTPDELDHLTGLDPLFPLNAVPHASRGRACRTGDTVLSVDGDGTLRRCHFVREPIGNLYDPGWRTALQPRPCPNETCGCHIGYVHLEHLGLDRVFGGGILERIPERNGVTGPHAAIARGW